MKLQGAAQHLDDIAKYNVDRWRSLASAEAIFTRPDFRLDRNSARKRLDPQGKLGDVVDFLGKKGSHPQITFLLECAAIIDTRNVR